MSPAEFHPKPGSQQMTLSQSRIFFAHQSVGQNILTGVSELISAHEIENLNLIETTDPDDFKQPVFGHACLGNNYEPNTKIQNFKKVLDSGIGELVDIAILKFCYVDIGMDTNINQLFASYMELATYLSRRFPRLVLVHVTIPLTRCKTSLFRKISRLFTENAQACCHKNLLRHTYNNRLIGQYDSETVFDLASIESTHATGKMEHCFCAGENIPSLVPLYTNDGGHLNERGRILVAGKFLQHLSKALLKKNHL